MTEIGTVEPVTAQSLSKEEFAELTQQLMAVMPEGSTVDLMARLLAAAMFAMTPTRESAVQASFVVMHLAQTMPHHPGDSRRLN